MRILWGPAAGRLFQGLLAGRLGEQSGGNAVTLDHTSSTAGCLWCVCVQHDSWDLQGGSACMLWHALQA